MADGDPRSLSAAASYEGIVLHGAKLGRTIGFPTANIALTGGQPAPGIYAAHVRLEDGRGRPGVAYFGSRPTVDGSGELLEVHLFNFSEDIYGSRLWVRLVAHIRGDVKFPSLELMIAQMEYDRAAAVHILKSATIHDLRSQPTAEAVAPATLGFGGTSRDGY